MAYKDLERKKKNEQAWREKNRGRYRALQKKSYLKIHPNTRSRDSYHDFETHRELAVNSGIQSQPEWVECHQRGFFPDGIYRNPDKTFNPKYSSKEKALGDNRDAT